MSTCHHGHVTGVTVLDERHLGPQKSHVAQLPGRHHDEDHQPEAGLRRASVGVSIASLELRTCNCFGPAAMARAETLLAHVLSALISHN